MNYRKYLVTFDNDGKHIVVYAGSTIEAVIKVCAQRIDAGLYYTSGIVQVCNKETKPHTYRFDMSACKLLEECK